LGKSVGTIVQVVGTAAGVATGNPGLIAGANAIGGAISSRQSANAAKDAAAVQQAAANNAIAEQRRQQEQVRADLQPFRDAGAETAPGLTKLVNDPNEQRNFIQNNPFYQTLADDAKNKLFANQAAKGKLGSGGTAQALQNSLLLLGESLLNNDVSRKQTLVNTGQNAAAQTGVLGQSSTQNITNLTTQGGNAQAAGIIGANNALSQGQENIANASVQQQKLDILRGNSSLSGLTQLSL